MSGGEATLELGASPVRRTTLDNAAIAAGLLGSPVIGGAALLAALAYTGVKGEPFSPLNHFVSELGEVGVSELASLFNLGLNLGGLAFVVFIVGFVATRSGRLRFAYGVTGVIAGIGGFFVGVFPMNQLDSHGLAALTFFLFGLATVLLGSIDIWRGPEARFPRWLTLVGVLDAVAFAVFLVLLTGEAEGLGHPSTRPVIWPLTTFEWLCLIGILVWVFLAAWAWWRATS